MTTEVAPLFSTSLVEVRRRTTPGLLWRGLWALWVADVLVLITLLYSGHVHRDGLKAIGKDSAPSIIAAQAIKSSLADMDAQAANELITGPESQDKIVQVYNERRKQAATALIKAAENITYGDKERQPILQIELAVSRYEALIQKARDLRSDGKPFLPFYQQAAALMDGTIIPAADALDRACLEELEAAYQKERSDSLNARFMAGAAVAGMLVLLGTVQLFLFRRTNRVVNVPLFAATILLAGFVLYTLGNLHGAGNDLRRAKEDAFTSIHALWRAMALGYSANADESRYVLDPAKAMHDFDRKRDAIATLTAGETWASMTHSSDPKAASGFLAEELDNITFPGELEAARETMRDFARYVDIDFEIRTLLMTGRTKDAVALCLGTAPGQSDWAFGQFGNALERTLRINQLEFDLAVQSGFSRLNGFDTKASIVAAILAVLCLLGIMQRIREYN